MVMDMAPVFRYSYQDDEAINDYRYSYQDDGAINDYRYSYRGDGNGFGSSYLCDNSGDGKSNNQDHLVDEKPRIDVQTWINRTKQTVGENKEIVISTIANRQPTYM